MMKTQEWENTLCEMMIPRKRLKSKTKQVCCADEFSEYIKADIPKSLALTRVLAVEQTKKASATIE